ncbi:hypothetical protein [Streptomyces sp. NPDC005131]
MAGALGLILPALLDTAEVLVPAAALGLAFLMAWPSSWRGRPSCTDGARSLR